jgi:integrase
MEEQVGQVRRGWWATHKYPPRRSVEDIIQFVGWETLEGIVKACERIPYNRWNQRNIEFIRRRDKALIVTSFLTGGRVNEVLDLKVNNFDLTSNDGYIIVRDMLLEKVWKYETLDNPVFASVKEYKAMGYKERRYFNLDEDEGMYVKDRITKRNTALSIRNDFPIHLDKDKDTTLAHFVTGILEPWITKYHRNKDEHLFASSDSRREGKPITGTRAYQIIRIVSVLCNVDIWPHWFRAQRASQLFNEWGLSWEELKLWFAWRTDVMAQRYARISVDELASRMEHKRSLMTER